MLKVTQKHAKKNHMKNDIFLFAAMFAVAWIGFKVANEQFSLSTTDVVAPTNVDPQQQVPMNKGAGMTKAAAMTKAAGMTKAATANTTSTTSSGDSKHESENWVSAAVSPEAQIKSMIRNRVDAWNARHIERYMADYRHFDSLSVNFTGTTKNGWQEVHDFIKSEYEGDMGTLRLSDIKIDVVDDRAAIVVALWTLTRSQSVTSGRMSLVLNKVDSAWKITAENLSLR